MNPALPVAIGYDSREERAFDICEASLRRTSASSLHVIKLNETRLRQAGFYRREWRQEGGNRIDMGDLKPFSTEFSFTRFLVPALSLYQGWVLYCDCDILFTADIAELFAHADDKYAVMCVKHDYVPKQEAKMGGIVQTSYARKNWSSLVMWNTAHPANREITPDVVNTHAGAWLHGFRWLQDKHIGEIPRRWNWLAGVDEPLGIVPAGIHYTLGVPGIHDGCEDMPYAELWRETANACDTQAVG